MHTYILISYIHIHMYIQMNVYMHMFQYMPVHRYITSVALLKGSWAACCCCSAVLSFLLLVRSWTSHFHGLGAMNYHPKTLRHVGEQADVVWRHIEEATKSSSQALYRLPLTSARGQPCARAFRACASAGLSAAADCCKQDVQDWHEILHLYCRGLNT